MNYTLTQAWEAYAAKDYTLAKRIFLALQAIAPSAETRRHHEMGYAYVLLAEGQRGEAEALLKRLYAETQDAKFLVPLDELNERDERQEKP